MGKFQEVFLDDLGNVPFRENAIMRETRKLVVLALMVSQALVLSIIESWIPLPMVFPGVKLGLANIVTLLVIIYFGYREALLVVFVRCVLASIFGGGFAMFLFSITGGVLSTLVMAVLYKRMSKYLGVVGISVSGSVTHNIGQLLMAGIMTGEFAVMSYLPVLLVSGVMMGCFVGLCSSFLSTALKRTGIIVKG